MTSSTYYFPDQHSAAEWRQMATDAARRSAESWERSDTDGFLTQWASDSSARMYRELADVAEAGNQAEIAWLFDAEGKPVEDWAWVKTRYGSTVRVGSGPNVVWFNPSQAAKGAQRLKRDLAKGYTFGTVKCEVVARFTGTLTLGIAFERKHGAELHVVSPVADHYETDF